MKYFLVLSLFFLTMAEVFGSCQHDLTGPGITYVVGENNPTATNSVTVDRRGNGDDCGRFFIGFSSGGASSYTRHVRNNSSNDTINYNLYKLSDSTGILKAQGDIFSNAETLFGNINQSQVIVTNYYFALAPISATSPPRFGTYTDSVTVRSYSGMWNDVANQEDNFNLNITVTVPKLTYLSLLSTGDAFDSTKTSKVLDFGELELNEELNFEIKLVSNAGYNLKVSSANNGKLKNTVGSGSDAFIDYQLHASNTLKGLSTSASAPVTIATGTGLTPAGGATVPIRVKIGTVDNKMPGDYEDVITVTVVSTD